MQKTFLFYDLETSGINKCFDQIFQFAAIRTDLELNELERHEILVKLNPDTIPDPQATITHHLSIEYLNEHGICEYAAVKKIHQLVNTPGTISIGYNTLGFDDEFLRFCFHRNLLTPYTHQFANNCSRMDIYPLIPVYYLFVRDCLKWPVSDGNKINFKLENLNTINQLHVNGRAHDAMVDIEVTIALAKKLKSYNAVWKYLLAGFKKLEDQSRLELLKGGLEVNGVFHKQAILVNGIFGNDNLFHVPTLYLGQHKSYKNQVCFLRMDLPELREVNQDNITEFIFGIKKKWGEVPFILPANKKYSKYLSQARLTEIAQNKEWFVQNPSKFEMIKQSIVTFKYPEYEHVDSDANLYSSSFPTTFELNLLDKFHQQNFSGKSKFMEQLSQSMQNRATRLLGRNAIEALAPDQQQAFQNYLEKIASFDKTDLPIDFKGNLRRSPADVYDKILELRQQDLTDEQQSLLDELEAYIC